MLQVYDSNCGGGFSVYTECVFMVTLEWNAAHVWQLLWWWVFCIHWMCVYVDLGMEYCMCMTVNVVVGFLGILSFLIQITCPNHLNLVFWVLVLILSTSSSSLMLVFLILSFVLFKIALRIHFHGLHYPLFLLLWICVSQCFYFQFKSMRW